MEHTVAINKDTLGIVEIIAKRAGEAIMAVYEKEDFGVETKSDNSPLTEADLAAHRVIEAALLEAFPDIPVLSEESGDVSYEQRKDWRCFWMVDPLDGTKEFVKRNGEFTVNIALIDQGVPVLGVVYVPVTGVSYFSWSGGGCWRIGGDQKPGQVAEQVRVRQLPAGGELAVVCSRSHRGDRLESLLQRLGNYRAVPTGSSLKLCLVAEGSADFYPRLGPTSEWDTAAAHALVLEAGGVVVDLQLQPLLYNQKESLLNPEFLVLPELNPEWLPSFEGL